METKKCKYCSTEIDKSAKVCPNCKKKQSHKGCLIFLVIIILFLVLLFKACDSVLGKDKKDEKKKVGNIESSGVSDSDNSKEPETASLGQYIEGSKFKISFLEANEYKTLKDSDSTYEKKPDAGKVFLVLVFEFENISDKGDHVNSFNFEAYEDGYSLKSTFTIVNIDGLKECSGDIAPGKKLKGCKVYQVNENWKELEVTYNDNMFTDSDLGTFKLKSEDVKR